MPLDVLVDVVSDELFMGGATAVGETRDADGGVAVTGGFESLDAARNAAERLTERFGGTLESVHIEDEEGDWVASQRAGLSPTHIEPWCVRGPWTTRPEDVDPRHDVVIEPGEAFGHGAHPSTVLAIELMLRELESARTSRHPPRVVDIGTGTGVVALIAARCGASVLAIESDPAAIAVAEANLRRDTLAAKASGGGSEAAGEVELRLADAASIADIDTADLVVANVTLDVQRRIAPNLQGATTVIASGILTRQVAQIRSTYPQHEARTIRNHGEWAGVGLILPKQLGATGKR